MLAFHLNNLTGLVLVYFLVFVRTGAMLMFLPPINQAGVPSRVRLVLALGDLRSRWRPASRTPIPRNAVDRRWALAVLVAEDASPVFSSAPWRRIIMSALSGRGHAHLDADGPRLRAIAQSDHGRSQNRSSAISCRCWAA